MNADHELSDLFPEEDYRFHMRFQRGEVAEFFGPTCRHAALLAQRRHWLRTAAHAHASLLPEGEPLLEETLALARRLGTVVASTAFPSQASPWQHCLALGEAWEPDYLLLRAEADGPFRLVGGCVCFPSSWSLAEKIGRPLEFIHGVVPGLNADLGSAIRTFLGKLRPGLAWRRNNWGLSRSPELNAHPDRRLPRLDATVGLDEVWLRVERQALAALPRTGGVLFGIRITVHPLAQVKRDAPAATRLARALRTMPEAMAEYKGLAAARAKIVEWLEA